MTMPFYVPPEQQMKDRAEFARKGIARGRSVVVLRYADGVCFIAQNPSGTLHKVSEIYDRIGFAAVGRYNEFEALRLAGIQSADVRGFTFDRADVSARALVNMYAQVLGTAFASVGEKPFEVELAVAEVGVRADEDRLYRIAYDGSVFEERGYATMGGQADAIGEALRGGFDASASLKSCVRLAASALSEASEDATPLEVAVLDRTRPRARKFARLDAARVLEMVR